MKMSILSILKMVVVYFENNFFFGGGGGWAKIVSY
jgi:hypothetical protein